MYQFVKHTLSTQVQRVTKWILYRRHEHPTLEDHLIAEFKFYGLITHPLVRQIKNILQQDRKTRTARARTAIAIVFTMGILAAHTWYGIQVSAIHELLAEWRQLHERDYKRHHDLKPVTAAVARSIVGRLERERELKKSQEDSRPPHTSLSIDHQPTTISLPTHAH